MTAKEARDKAINSVNREIEMIENKIEGAASAGGLSITVCSISDAARVYFKANGFEVKIILDMCEEKKDKPDWKIVWDK